LPTFEESTVEAKNRHISWPNDNGALVEFK
jgi:hypothetical protein